MFCPGECRIVNGINHQRSIIASAVIRRTPQQLMTKRKFSPNYRPDLVSEELLAALGTKRIFEFNELFLEVYAKLQARNATSGGEEMLRLRLYEKLQNLVGQGVAKKTGKKYQGVLAAVRARCADVDAARTKAAERKAAAAVPAE